jgi:hypothetical protein
VGPRDRIDTVTPTIRTLQTRRCPDSLQTSIQKFNLKYNKPSISTLRGIWLRSLSMVKFSPYKPWRHTSCVDVQFHAFLTSVPDGRGWSVSRPDRFTPGICPRYAINRRLAGPQSLFGHFGEEINLSPLPGIEPRTVQPVTWSLYAIPLPSLSTVRIWRGKRCTRA